MNIDAFLESVHRLKVSCEMLGLKHPPMITLATAEEGLAIEQLLRRRLLPVESTDIWPDTKPMRMIHVDGVPIQYPQATRGYTTNTQFGDWQLHEIAQLSQSR